MKLQNIFRNRSVFIKLIISYFFILFIPIVINSVYYYHSINIIENHINDAQTSSLNQLKYVIDGELEEIQSIELELALNNRINTLAGLERPLNPLELYEKTYIANNLYAYKTANNFIKDIYISFNKNNFIIGYNGSSDFLEYYNSRLDNIDLKYEDWKANLNTKHLNDHIIIKDKLTASEKIDFLTTLPTGRSNVTNASVVVEMDLSTINEALKNLKYTSKGNLIILDKNDNILTSTAPIILPTYLKYENMKASSGLMHKSFQGEYVIVSYTTSSITGWKYISIMPSTDYLKELNNAELVIILSFFLCLFIGSLVAYSFSKKIYNPLNKLISLFNSNDKTQNKFRDNEYTFIEKSILNILTEKEKVFKKLDDQKEMLKENFLRRLLIGNISSLPSEPLSDMYDINFSSDNFSVILIYIEDYSDLFYKKFKPVPEEIIEISEFILRNIFQEIMNIEQLCYLINMNSSLACLINFKNLSEDSLIKLKKNCEYGKLLIFDKFGINLTISISNIHNEIKNISKAYDEAVEALEYKLLLGNNHVICYTDINENANSVNYNNFNIEHQKFINCIKIKEYMAAKEILCKLLTQISSTYSLQIVKTQMFTLINTMLSTMEEVSGYPNFSSFENLNHFEKLVNCQSVNELKNEMLSILDQFIDFDKDSTKNVTNLLSQIKLYIERSHSDMNLSVSLIAEHFKINPNYLSRIFKQNYNIGVLNYIHNIRINNAKILLEKDTLSVKEIAEKVGYYNDITFIRVFKKYQGITPGKYKEIIIKAEVPHE